MTPSKRVLEILRRRHGLPLSDKARLRRTYVGRADKNAGYCLWLMEDDGTSGYSCRLGGQGRLRDLACCQATELTEDRWTHEWYLDLCAACANRIYCNKPEPCLGRKDRPDTKRLRRQRQAGLEPTGPLLVKDQTQPPI